MPTLFVIPGADAWSENESKIISVLSDGKAHPIKNFYRNETNPDHLDSYNSAVMTIRRIRKKLEGTGHAVLTTYERRTTYWRLVRLISRD